MSQSKGKMLSTNARHRIDISKLVNGVYFIELSNTKAKKTLKFIKNNNLKANWITNKDGSIYHLGLHVENISETIITVGDQNRVKSISQYFDKLEFTKSNREFITHTGWIGNKRLTVISTGIGTDNIDIVFNELDALFNIDLISGQPKDKFQKIDFIRIGTSGTIKGYSIRFIFGF